MKITKYFLSMAAAVGMIAGCQKTEIVKIAAPEDVVAPVLKELDGAIEITPSNMVDGKVTFEWTSADYGANVQVDYSLEAALASAPDTKISITSGVTDTTLVVAYENLNALLYNDLEIPDGVAIDVLFSIGAKVGELAKIYSNAITVPCKVTAAEKEYPKIYVVGGFNGWSHAAASFLFDFAGTDAVYQGMIDFGSSERADEGFKITPNGDWSAEWGQDGTPDAEAASTVLLTSGGSNITIYQLDRFYHFALDKGTNILTKNVSFDQIGVIGDFNGWGADVVMEFNASKQRFYADVEFPADGGFKFRLDGAWDVSYGSKTEGVLDSGDNIPVKAGNYRVYLNMNNFGEMTYELNAAMYGQEEPTAGTTTPEPEPEPTPVTGWSLIGAFNEWAGDLMLTSDGTFYVVKGAELEGELKFRKDGQWNYKDEEGNEIQTNFGAAEGVTFAANTELALVGNGANIVVTAGTYDVYLDAENAKAWFITDGSYPGGGAAPELSTWALIGEFNGWAGDYPMYIEGEYHVAKGFVVAADGKMKFRKDGMWNYKDDEGNDVQTNLGGTFAAGAEIALTAGGSDIAVPAGTYDVYLKVAEDGQSGFAYFMAPGKTPADAGEAVITYVDASAETFVVGFSGSAIGWDDPSFEAGDRASFKSKVLTDEAKYAGTYTYELASLAVAANDSFKVRLNGDWIGNGGAEIEGITLGDPDGDGNFVASESGTFKVTITFTWDGLKASDVKAVFVK